MTDQQRDPGVQAAIDAAGNMSKLADKLEISREAISQWRRIPAERIIQVERATGVPRHLLRPDLYPSDDEEPVSQKGALNGDADAADARGAA